MNVTSLGYDSWELILVVLTKESAVALVALSPSATVNVASSFTVPVSFLAVRSWLGITFIVNVSVSVPPFPSDTV